MSGKQLDIGHLQESLSLADACFGASRYNEKMMKMVRGVDSTYEELFAYACPKFITAAPPNLDAPSANTNQVSLLYHCPRPLAPCGKFGKGHVYISLIWTLDKLCRLSILMVL